MQWYILTICNTPHQSVSDFRCLWEAEGPCSNSTQATLYVAISTGWKRNTGRPRLHSIRDSRCLENGSFWEITCTRRRAPCTQPRRQSHALAYGHMRNSHKLTPEGPMRCIPRWAWYSQWLATCFLFHHTINTSHPLTGTGAKTLRLHWIALKISDDFRIRKRLSISFYLKE